jgi:hypothetical protein
LEVSDDQSVMALRLEQKKNMRATANPEQTIAQRSEMSLQRQWPKLGRELFTLESALTDTVCAHEIPLTERESTEKRARIRAKIIAQLYRDDEKYSLDLRYCALLLVAKGRGAEIVGNPYCIGKDGKKQELPYTGLEGYYAGSEMTSEHPGMTPQVIVQEEANRGVALLASIKKHHVDHYSWASFAKMKKALEGAEPDVKDLRNLALLWAEVVRRLHVRVYSNKEFEGTITEHIEQIEKLLGAVPGRTEEEKECKNLLQAEYVSLKKQRDNMSEEEKANESKERRERESIRRARLREYKQFREVTYALLKEAGNKEYGIDVRDSSWKEANIIEMISIPKTRDRNEYTPIEVKFTPQQLEGYLFLAQLGQIGGDPLARSVLIRD